MSDGRRQPDDGTQLYSEDVSRAYRLGAREEPSPELDAAIHAAAMRAAGRRSRVAHRTPLRAWGVPIAVAATIVIGISIAFLAADRPDSPVVPISVAPLPSLRESEPALPTPSAPPESTDKALAASAPPTPQAASETNRSHVPAAATTREERPTRERSTRQQPLPRRDQSMSPPMAPSAEASAAGGAADAAPAAGVSEAGRPPMAPGAMWKSAPAAAAQQGEEAEPTSPEVWLERIRELRNKGDLAQADASLRAFRHRYPDYPLPADLDISPTPELRR